MKTAVELLIEQISLKEKTNETFLLPTIKNNIFEQAKELEKQQQGYSEEDMTKFISFVGKNYIKAKGFYYMKGDFEKKHKVSIHQILEQFKKK